MAECREIFFAALEWRAEGDWDIFEYPAAAGALLAFEGNNEPINWGVTYHVVSGGGRAASWLAVAKLQRDLYQAVKSDPALKKYPVWSLSENGVP